VYHAWRVGGGLVGLCLCLALEDDLGQLANQGPVVDDQEHLDTTHVALSHHLFTMKFIPLSHGYGVFHLFGT